MRRNLLMAALAALLGTVFMTADASACCHKKKACPEPACAPAPAPCVTYAEPCAPPKKHGCFGGMMKNRGGGLFAHMRAKHHKVETCATPAPCAPMMAYPSMQTYPSMQAAPSMQSMGVPTKQMPGA